MPPTGTTYRFGEFDITPEQYRQLQFIDLLGRSGIVDVGAGQEMIMSALMAPQMGAYGGLGGPGGLGGYYDPYGMGMGGEELMIEVPDEAAPAPPVPYAGAQLPAPYRPFHAVMSLIPGFKGLWGPPQGAEPAMPRDLGAAFREATATAPRATLAETMRRRFSSLLGE